MYDQGKLWQLTEGKNVLDACITVHVVKLIFNVQLERDKLVHEEKTEIPEGRGVFTKASGIEILRGWEVKMKKPSVGEVQIFSAPTH